jgi:hypothetical protein
MVDIPTWNTLRQLASDDPIIYHALSLVEDRSVSREQALIVAIVALHDHNRSLQRMIEEHIRWEPAVMFNTTKERKR